MSSILDLALERGLSPKRTSNASGGEYHSGCPRCGGKDRFALWPRQGRYWCRQCDVKGDEIQFCRDFLELSFQAACSRVGNHHSMKKVFFEASSEGPRLARQPTNLWREKAAVFVSYCVSLNNLSEAEKLLLSRGISISTAKTYSLGYNPRFWRRDGARWGLEDGQNVSLPAGLVIPSFEPETDLLLGLKIRKIDPRGNKYHQVVGSSDALYVLGYRKNIPLVVLESELDAILLMQEAGDQVWAIAIGGNTKKPDLYLEQLIRGSPLIIHVPDFDDPGAVSISYWSKYPRYKLYCTPKAKSVGDAYLVGLDLHHWIAQIIKRSDHG